MNNTTDFQSLMPSPFDMFSYFNISIVEIILIGLIGSLVIFIGHYLLLAFEYILGEIAVNFDPKSFYMSAIVVLLWLIYIKL